MVEQNVKSNESKIDDEQLDDMMEALEFLDKLDKTTEDAARSQKESDTSSVPTDKEMYLTGTELFKEQRYEEAASLFDELVLQFPNSQYAEGATHLSAQGLLLLERYEAAASKFDELMLNFPEKAALAAEAAYKSSYCMSRLGRYDEALRRYEQTVMNYPNSPWILATYFDMGMIYHKQGNLDRAKENYRITLQHAKEPAMQAEIQGEIDRINIESAR